MRDPHPGTLHRHATADNPLLWHLNTYTNVVVWKATSWVTSRR